MCSLLASRRVSRRWDRTGRHLAVRVRDNKGRKVKDRDSKDRNNKHRENKNNIISKNSTCGFICSDVTSSVCGENGLKVGRNRSGSLLYYYCLV